MREATGLDLACPTCDLTPYPTYHEAQLFALGWGPVMLGCITVMACPSCIEEVRLGTIDQPRKRVVQAASHW